MESEGLFSVLGGDVVSWGCVLAAVSATLAAWAVGRRGRFLLAALLLVTAGVLLRANLSHRYWLSDWDERYHAVVARNAIDEPWVPSLIPAPFDEYPPYNWGQAEVWLHKPPLATWLIAGSLRAFGVTEPAVRIPSVVFAGLGIFLTFLVGRRLLGAPVGLLAAGIHAWHARLAQLAAGLRATDHVDHQFSVLVALGAWLALRSADDLVRGEGAARGWITAAACGLVLGLALLTKSLPALVIVGVFGLALWAARASLGLRFGAPAVVLGIGWLVQLPWSLYTSRLFPEHAAVAAGRNAFYFKHVVAGQDGPPWFYLAEMGTLFGVFAPVAVGWFLWHNRARRELWPIVGWLVATYAVFSLSQTKMTGYVLIAAPPVMLAMGWAWREAGSERFVGMRRLAARGFAAALLLGFALGPVARVHRPWRSPERRPVWAEELRFFGDRVAELGPGTWLVFNTPSAEEARFYTRATLLARLPSEADLEKARERGFHVAVYGEPGDPIPPRDGIRFVPRDPRAEDQRRVLAQLPSLAPGEEAWIWNSREPKRLEEYIERFVPADVRGRLPQAAEFERARDAHAKIVILVEPGAPDPEFAPDLRWTRVDTARFAR